jgi:hypothetical protein
MLSPPSRLRGYNIPMLPAQLKPPSVALSRLTGAPRERLEAARSIAARAVTPDATQPGLRPRELARSDRRGLAATLRRLELRLAGLDLPIPPEHFASPKTQDRALAAATAAMEFLAEASALVKTDPILSIPYPEANSEVARESAETLGRAALDLGVTLAATASAQLPPGWSRCVDLARAIDAGASPLKAVSTAIDLVMIRLTDADASGRRALGEGRLDLPQLAAVVATSAPEATLVLDPLGLPDPLASARTGLAAWTDAGELFPRP